MADEIIFFALLFVSIFTIDSAGEKPVQVTVNVGEHVILPCRAPTKNIYIVEWSRADLRTEYVLLYRDGQFLAENQHPSFKNRVELQDRQMKDGDVSLILKYVTTNDTGTYECHVKTETMRRKRANLDCDPISIINLTVRPGSPGGTSKDRHVGAGSVGVISNRSPSGRSVVIAGLSVSDVSLFAPAFVFLIYN